MVRVGLTEKAYYFQVYDTPLGHRWLEALKDNPPETARTLTWRERFKSILTITCMCALWRVLLQHGVPLMRSLDPTYFWLLVVGFPIGVTLLLHVHTVYIATFLARPSKVDKGKKGN